MVATMCFSGYSVAKSLFFFVRVLLIALALVGVIVVCCALAYVAFTFIVATLIPFLVVICKLTPLVGGLIWIAM